VLIREVRGFYGKVGGEIFVFILNSSFGGEVRGVGERRSFF